MFNRQLEKYPSSEENQLSPYWIESTLERASVSWERASLSSIMASYGAFPEGTLYIGMFGDGLPLIFDWNHPKPGSTLIE
jgi:hypothetical protein